MDVVEQYPWSGETVIHKRRDKRKGTHTGHVERTKEGPQLRSAFEKVSFGLSEVHALNQEALHM